VDEREDLSKATRAKSPEGQVGFGREAVRIRV